MYISIQRRFFKEDPARRFSREFGCSPDVWREAWRRYKFLDYTENEAREYMYLIYRLKLSHKAFRRWINRTEVYIKSKVAIERGTKEVNSSYFGPLKDFVEREITKNL